MVKTSNRPTLGNLNPIPTPSLPFDIWALDTIVLGPAANDTRAKYAQVFIDHHSRYIWASPTAKNTTDAVLTVFRKLVSSGVQPKILITDNGKNFTSKNFKSFLKDNDIQHRFISPYHPEANGLVEKANHTLITGIKLHILDHPKHKWTTALTEVVKNYNRTPHSVTGFKPTFLQFGLDEDNNSFTVEEARRLATERSLTAQARRKEHHDNLHPSSDFDIGDFVLRRLPSNHPDRVKTSPALTGPYIVLRQLGPETYRLGLLAANMEDVLKIITAHSSLLRRFHPRIEINKEGRVRRNATED